MGYNRYGGEEYYGRGGKIYPEYRTSRRPIIIAVTLSITFTITLGVVLYYVIIPRLGITPNTPYPNNIVHLWNSQPQQIGQVTGPAVISGDFDVNGVTVHQGQRDEGTVIILADNATYTLSGQNEGTIYTPDRWQPSLSDMQAEAQQIVNDQHTHGCVQGLGCINSYVATFQNGQESSAGVQNPSLGFQ